MLMYCDVCAQQKALRQEDSSLALVAKEHNEIALDEGFHYDNDVQISLDEIPEDIRKELGL